MSGTSFSAPIVSGAAALVLSVLGAGNGEYRRGAQARQVLLSSAAIPSTGSLPVTTSSRVAVAGAVNAALVEATTNPKGTNEMPLTKTGPAYEYNGMNTTVTGPNGVPLSVQGGGGQRLPVMAQGFTETYYRLPDEAPLLEVPANGTEGLPVVDKRHVPGGASFHSFRHTVGILLSISTHVRLDSPGLYSIKVSTDTPTTSYRLMLGGQQVQLTSEGVGTAAADNPGYFSIELLLAHPIARVELLIRTPTIYTFGPLQPSSCFSFATTRYRTPAMGPARTPSASRNAGLLGVGWLVRFNMSHIFPSIPSSNGPSNSPVPYGSLSYGLTALASGSGMGALKYTAATVVPDVTFLAPGALYNALGLHAPELSQGGGGGGVVVGEATSVIKSGALPRHIAVQVRAGWRSRCKNYQMGNTNRDQCCRR